MTEARPPSEVGALTELTVATALLEAGLAVFVPFFSAHRRVDLVYVTHVGELRRVQCKTARLVDNVVVFAACSHTGGRERSYVDEADDFGVFCPAMDAVYLVPVDEVPRRVARLRVGPARNNQQQGVRWAEPYRLKLRTSHAG